MTAAEADQHGLVHHKIFDRVFVVICDDEGHDFQADTDFAYFCVESILSYVPIETDFGPYNLQNTYEFCQIVDNQLELSKKKIALISSPNREVLSNTVLVFGIYMIMVHDYDLDGAIKNLEPLMKLTVPFRDVGRDPQMLDLHVRDCLGGIYRAKRLGWVDFGSDGFDFAEYKQLDDPLNADLHEIIPGKILAMRGPRDLINGAMWLDIPSDDGGFDHREFSPAHYAAILNQFDVQVIVRCNSPQYDRAGFELRGIVVVDLVWEDCSPPPVEIVAKFLAVAERLPGALAVHGSGGLGRSGTLVGLYMMKHHGFTAREAIGWMRIVRPGRCCQCACATSPARRKGFHLPAMRS